MNSRICRLDKPGPILAANAKNKIIFFGLLTVLSLSRPTLGNCHPIPPVSAHPRHFPYPPRPPVKHSRRQVPGTPFFTTRNTL